MVVSFGFQKIGKLQVFAVHPVTDSPPRRNLISTPANRENTRLEKNMGFLGEYIVMEEPHSESL
jgi:hypothetical protein